MAKKDELKILAMEEYCLKDELEFLGDIYGQSVLALKSDNKYVPKTIDKRMMQLKARLRSIQKNKDAILGVSE